MGEGEGSCRGAWNLGYHLACDSPSQQGLGTGLVTGTCLVPKSSTFQRLCLLQELLSPIVGCFAVWELSGDCFTLSCSFQGD